MPATAPGTAADVLLTAGRWQPGQALDPDAEDWWFITSFRNQPADRGEEVILGFDGIATVAEVFLNDELLVESSSMFARHGIDVTDLLRSDGNELAIRCRALGPLLGAPRRPRARWRTRLVPGGLRFFRTTAIGRAPGFTAGPAVVGPWRSIWIERREGLAVEEVGLRTRLAGDCGLLAARALMRELDGAEVREVEVVLSGPSGSHRATLATRAAADGVEARGEMRIPEVARWWPHTHGEPVLHQVRLRVETSERSFELDAGRVGFRELAAGPPFDDGSDAPGLRINGVSVFVRGAVWSPTEPIGLTSSEEQLRRALECARRAGMNMVRIPGAGIYESACFHDLCDELGILVWQDFMFANLDYPLTDEGFRTLVEEEAAEVLAGLGGRPSLAVLCGNSEVEQQVAMLGLDPALSRGELFEALLPALVERADVDAIYLPSTPSGGALPFRTSEGVAHYYGVGAYRRPLEDARLAEVSFAAECLAFANVPDTVVASLPWKDGVPRDPGASWDFDDVRDHYMEILFGVDPEELRRRDRDHYLELSRFTTAEAMAHVFAEWRRGASPCTGGLVLWMHDLAPGAGWGLIDFDGAPKCAYHYLRRLLAPTAVWMTDEGLNGVGVHLANDRPVPLAATLRVALYADLERKVGEVSDEIVLEPHGNRSFDLEAMLGRFVDASWAYQFGPPAQNLIVASLEQVDAEARPISSAFHFAAGRPVARHSPALLGLEASVRWQGDAAVLALRCKRFVYGLRIGVEGLRPEDDALSLEPGVDRLVELRPGDRDQLPGSIRLTALNMSGAISVPLRPDAPRA